MSICQNQEPVQNGRTFSNFVRTIEPIDRYHGNAVASKTIGDLTLVDLIFLRRIAGQEAVRIDAETCISDVDTPTSKVLGDYTVEEIITIFAMS